LLAGFPIAQLVQLRERLARYVALFIRVIALSRRRFFEPVNPCAENTRIIAACLAPLAFRF
jgi:hypothetical protein